jgi:hypothetical protein
LTHYSSSYPSTLLSLIFINVVLIIIPLLAILQFEIFAALVLIPRSGLITGTVAVLVIVRFGLLTLAALVTASSVLIGSLISPIPQISSFACIRAFVLEMCLEKLFDRPTVRELLEIGVTLACL